MVILDNIAAIAQRASMIAGTSLQHTEQRWREGMWVKKVGP